LLKAASPETFGYTLVDELYIEEELTGPSVPEFSLIVPDIAYRCHDKPVLL
jgi:hypothetical protein